MRLFQARFWCLKLLSTKNEYIPQLEGQLQNFKTLMLLEIALLMGTDVEWAIGAAPAYPPASVAPASVASASGPVLEASAANDDADIF